MTVIIDSDRTKYEIKIQPSEAIKNTLFATVTVDNQEIYEGRLYKGE